MQIKMHLRFRENGSHTHSLMVTRDLKKKKKKKITNNVQVAQVCMVMTI